MICELSIIKKARDRINYRIFLQRAETENLRQYEVNVVCAVAQNEVSALSPPIKSAQYSVPSLLHRPLSPPFPSSIPLPSALKLLLLSLDFLSIINKTNKIFLTSNSCFN